MTAALALRQRRSTAAATNPAVAALRVYQHEAIDWLLNTTSLNHNRFLVLDPGLGKTAIAIRAAYLAGAQNVLVICPAIARIIWAAELIKWWPTDNILIPELLVVQPGTSIRRPVPRPGWTVIAYSNLSITSDPWLRRLAKLDWDVVIIDECQYLKGASNRTHAVYGGRLDAPIGSLAGTTNKVWLLSGTPAPNHAGELYPHLKALFREALPAAVRTVFEFENRFCNVQDTVYGRRITGSKISAIPELRDRLRPHVFRRRREDVLTDLPPLAFYDTPIDAENTLPLPLGTATLDNPDDDDQLIAGLQRNEAALATGRRALGESKIAASAAFCEETLLQMAPNHQKLVVFAYHRSVIRGLAAELSEFAPVVIDGSTSQRDREIAITRFQQDVSRTQILIGQIQAAGTAITLTAAHTAVFVETSWVPAENYQAALRIHRLGQANACTIHFLYVPGSLDHRIMRAYRRKASELSHLFEHF
jgi:SNF2 family DNA or RNA helicase